jgi:hypothetical protein
MKFSLIFLFSAILFGCSEEEAVFVPEIPMEDNWVNVEIEIPAGYYPEESGQRHFPLIFNLGKVSGGDDKVILLSESLAMNSRIKTRPLGSIEFGKTDPIKLLVVVPVDETIKSPVIADFKEFLFEYESMKRMLENWLIYNQYPIAFSHFHWQDDITTLKWLKEKYSKIP